MALSKRALESLSRLLESRTVHGEEESGYKRVRASVEEFLPGGVVKGRHGQIYVHERLRSEMERNTRHVVSCCRKAELSALRSGLEGKAEELERLGKTGFSRVVFLDIESTGLFNCPTFLIGTMSLCGDDFVIRQFFARDYSEEKCLIEVLSKHLAQFDAVVTFNGKSFDIPFIRDRAVYHGIRSANRHVDGLFHLDLLHHSRRHWRGVLPDCRLQTLEYHVCHRRRVGDIPGCEIPRVYHDFVRTGDPYPLVPVFHHNILDLVTMSELLLEIMTLDGMLKKAKRRPPAQARRRA
jgi:uncharacterized protein YprB with RNaseH-like and TPR domain